MKASCRCTVGASPDYAQLHHSILTLFRRGQFLEAQLLWRGPVGGTQEVSRRCGTWRGRSHRGSSGVMGPVEIRVYLDERKQMSRFWGEMEQNNTTSTSLVLYTPMLLQAQSMHIQREIGRAHV